MPAPIGFHALIFGDFRAGSLLGVVEGYFLKIAAMSSGTILVVDDETKLRRLIGRVISLEGYQVFEASDLKSAKQWIDREDFDVVVCDVRLPDGSGVDFTKDCKNHAPAIEIIILTANGNIQEAIQAMKNGAFDYIVKGNDNEKLLPLVGEAIEKSRLQKRANRLENTVNHSFGFKNIIGKSTLIRETIAMAEKCARIDTAVFLNGETGVGKELFAQAIHISSDRSSKAFLALNCSAFSDTLLESELFGHKAGAFTGASKDKRGLIEEANEGTLFLDEIGELEMDIQAKLLRVLETGEFIKLGDASIHRVNVRIISATNKDLQYEIARGKFREDLFYRLNVFPIRIPSLRERSTDIPLLSQHFLKIYADKTNKQIGGMSKDFISHLQRHYWKGNIRELKNVIERAVILADEPILTVKELPQELQVILSEKGRILSAFDLASVEKLHIQRMLNHTKGNKMEAARLLNIGLTTIYRKMEEYGLN
jgi:two-component system, NtrC family, response regulator